MPWNGLSFRVPASVPQRDGGTLPIFSSLLRVLPEGLHLRDRFCPERRLQPGGFQLCVAVDCTCLFCHSTGRELVCRAQLLRCRLSARRTAGSCATEASLSANLVGTWFRADSIPL